MSKILLTDYTPKTGVYKTGPNAGKPYAIAVGLFSGLNRSVNRIIANVDVAKAFKGQMVAGRLVEAQVQPFSFKDKEGKDITATTKWVVQFDGESLESAIKAHGKKPAVQASVLMQESADVAI